MIEQNASLKEELKRLGRQNWMHEFKIKRMEEEFDVVNWYTQFLNDGVDTKDLCKEMAKIKDLNRKLEEDIEKMTAKYKKEITELQEKLKSTKSYLIK